MKLKKKKEFLLGMVGNLWLCGPKNQLASLEFVQTLSVLMGRKSRSSKAKAR